ncbi:MAG: porin [Ignavibacteriales bacterium]|nr:porin [Ignavibacteriales bacterium]
MRRATISIAAAALLVLIPLTAAFSGGFQLNEHGARAMGQGGAFAARASDLSAIYFNPAGLAYQKGTQVYVGVTLIMPKTSFFGPDQLNTNQETQMVSQVFNPINVYASYQITDDLVAAVGVNNPYGLGTEWPANWSGRFISTKVNLETFFFSPTLAYKLSDKFSIGVGMNYATGKVTLKRVLSDPFDPHANANVEATGTGIGWNVGAMYKASKDLSVGVSYRSEVKIDATGTAAFDPMRSVYPAGDVSSSLALPATGFLGIAYSPTKDLTLEADYQYVGWSSYKELALTFKKDNSVSVSPKNYEDTYILRVGGEYTMGEWQVRAGYMYDHSPAPTKYVEPLLPDATKNDFSVGLGYNLTKNITVDLAYMYIKFDQRKAVGTEINFDGTYNSTAHLFAVNFGYSF